MFFLINFQNLIQCYMQYYQNLNILNHNFPMEETKNAIKKRWTFQEDEALKQIKESLHYKSWHLISKKMATDFGFVGRSEKQCRDRYENYLKAKDSSFSWTDKQQAQMFQMFARKGSKWQLISTSFKNIKGIHIKNKFYTRVRKAIRQVNAVIELYFSKKFSPFQFSIISKVVSLISRRIEQTKQDQPDENQLQGQIQQTKILLELIQLTNPGQQELFPQLQIKSSPQAQRKRRFKNLIRKLKIVQNGTLELHKNAQPNHYKEFAIKTQQNSKNGQIPLPSLDGNRSPRVPSNQCIYKLLQNQKKKNKCRFKIISRIKKCKYFEAKRLHTALEEKEQQPCQLQYEQFKHQNEQYQHQNEQYQLQNEQKQEIRPENQMGQDLQGSRHKQTHNFDKNSIFYYGNPVQYSNYQFFNF